MKGYFLFAPVEKGCIGADSGIERKVRAQHKSLSMYCNCDLVIIPVVEYGKGLMQGIVRRMPGTAAWRKWEYRGEFNDADFLFVREVYEDGAFIRYLKKIKEANPRIRIIYEIPTYPENTGAKTSLSSLPYRIKRRHARARLHLYVDRIVTYYGQDEIYNIPCIKMINGYDFSQIELPQRKVTDKINIISVAMNATWHGYDRLIRGIEKYYTEGGKEDIVYHLIGNPLPEYGQTNQHLIIHGAMHGNELSDLYKSCLLGVDVLGGHRKNYPVSSSLKSREYGAYGLPILTSSPVDYLSRNSSYQLILPYDDTPIDMVKIIKYYHELYDGKDNNLLANDIRKNAEQKCSMEATMKPVVEWLKEQIN